MAGNCFGEVFKIMTWGESHGSALGVVIDGCPPGIELSLQEIQTQLNRRKPGQSATTTPRKESDIVEILSGVFDGKTTGTSLSMIIKNSDARSHNYDNVKEVYRPGHADYTYDKKYGYRDYRGGGRSSGRETAARVAAGAVAQKVLSLSHVSITAYTTKIGAVESKKFDPREIEKNPVRCADSVAAEKMIELIKDAKKNGDSVGGVVEIKVEGVPAGLGEPVFDKLDADIAKALMSIGAVKGVEIGDGFDCATRRGSENNDELFQDGERVSFQTNHAGGILGGISNGDTIVARMAVKPTASIFLSQKTVTRGGEETEIRIEGRHDPCICPRIVPVAEAMIALVLVDHLLRQKAIRFR